MDPFVQKIIADVNLSSLERYKHYYNVLSSSSISVRKELEDKIKKDISNFKSLIKEQEIISAIRNCLKFQYLKIKYLFRNYGGQTYDEIRFYDRVASVIEWINVKNSSQATFRSYKGSNVKFTSEEYLTDFELSLDSEEKFISILTNYAIKNANLNEGELNFQIIDLCLEDSRYFEGKRTEYREGYYLKQCEEEKKEIHNRIFKERMSWFPSERKINELRDETLIVDKKMTYHQEVEKYFNEFLYSFKRIEEYKQLIFNNLHWQEALETLKFVNDGASLKHFLLEKGYDLGMFTGKLD